MCATGKENAERRIVPCGCGSPESGEQVWGASLLTPIRSYEKAEGRMKKAEGRMKKAEC
jgi:hypothetical protein